MYWSGAGVGSRGRHDDGVVHRAVFLERAHHLCERGAFLPGADVDAVNVGVLLVDDSVDRDSGLSGLPVTDDEFALSASDGNHAVDGFDAGLQRLLHGLAIHHAGGDNLKVLGIIGLNGAFAVDGLAQRVHDASGQRLADWHLNDAARAPDLVAFLDGAVIAQEHGADVVGFEVQRHSVQIAREGQQLTGHALLEAIYAGDAVAHRNDAAGLCEFDRGVESLDLLLYDLADFFGANLHGLPP